MSQLPHSHKKRVFALWTGVVFVIIAAVGDYNKKGRTKKMTAKTTKQDNQGNPGARRAREDEQASQYARSLIEASLDPLVTISPEGKITDVNEATVKVTGVPRVEHDLIADGFVPKPVTKTRLMIEIRRVMGE